MSGGRITFGCSLSVEDYWDVPAFARRAEELGFQRITMGEHIMDGESAASHGAEPARPWPAAAGATEDIRVMTGIVIVPLYHPVMLAKLVASVDQVSGGAAGLRYRDQRPAGNACGVRRAGHLHAHPWASHR